MPSQGDNYSFDLMHAGSEIPFRLGLKELLFLSFIFFFAFCGFTICVDKMYGEVPMTTPIEKVILHDASAASIGMSEPPPAGYEVR